MFTTEHFIWMGICIAFVAVLTFISVKFKFSFRTSAVIIALIALASEVSKIISHMEPVNGADASDGMVIEATALPLHLCSLLIFAFFYLPFCKKEGVKKYLISITVPVGLVGSLLAILMATSGTDFLSPNAYQCFVYHAAMIWFVMYLMITRQAELGVSAWLKNLLTLFSLSMLMIWVNGALQVYDTNFLYVVRPPVDGLPLLNLNNGWYAYFGTVLLCGFVGVTAVHLPYIIMDIKNAKSKKN